MSTELKSLARANEGGSPPCAGGCSLQQPGSDQATGPLGSLEPPLMTVDELSDYLRVERKTLYDAIARGELPGVRRIGRLIRISRSAVLAWLLEGQGRVSRSRGRT